MAPYRVELSKSVQKFLRAHRDVAPAFFDRAVQLAQDPFRDDVDVKRMVGTPRDLWRLRISKYRFIYEVDRDTVTLFFFEAGNRVDVYR